MRYSKGIVSNTVTFTKDMDLQVKKETFLVNKGNKQRFVTLLKDTFNANGIAAIQAEDDVDLLIVQTTVTKSDNKEVVVFGEDTDLLALLQIPPSVSMIKHSGRTQSFVGLHS
jgi:hypothetical protein